LDPISKVSPIFVMSSWKCFSKDNRSLNFHQSFNSFSRMDRKIISGRIFFQVMPNQWHLQKHTTNAAIHYNLHSYTFRLYSSSYNSKRVNFSYVTKTYQNILSILISLKYSRTIFKLWPKSDKNTKIGEKKLKIKRK
jgi:hypothetical protein